MFLRRLLLLFLTFTSSFAMRGLFSPCSDKSKIRDCFRPFFNSISSFRPIYPQWPVYSIAKLSFMDYTMSNICRAYNEVFKCFGPNMQTCLDMETVTSIQDPLQTPQDTYNSLQYLSFLQYACGVGRRVTLMFDADLRQDFTNDPIASKLHRCGFDRLANDDAFVCRKSFEVTRCMSDSFLPDLVLSQYFCEATTNVIRVNEKVDITCLAEMEDRCKHNTRRLLTSGDSNIISTYFVLIVILLSLM